MTDEVLAELRAARVSGNPVLLTVTGRDWVFNRTTAQIISEGYKGRRETAWIVIDEADFVIPWAHIHEVEPVK